MSRSEYPKKLTKIEVRDARGTSISLTLFMSTLQHADFTRELIGLWETQFSGKPDEITIDGVAAQIAELDKQAEPHTP